MKTDPKTAGVTPPLPRQQQEPPGFIEELDPKPDHGEHSYRGCGKLEGRAALITGADSGIGRAVAIAFAREGADVLISYLSEHDDAKETARWVEEAGRKAVLIAGDVKDPVHCRRLVDRARNVVESSLCYNLAATRPGTRTKIQNVVGSPNRFFIVLDYNDGVP